MTTALVILPANRNGGSTIKFVFVHFALQHTNHIAQALELAKTTAEKSYFVDDNFGNVRGAQWAHCAFLYDAALDAKALAGTGAGGGVGNLGELKPGDGVEVIHRLDDLRKVWSEIFKN